MRAPITDKHLLEMMWERFPEIMQRGTEQPAQQIDPKTRSKDGLKYSPNYVAGYNDGLKAAQPAQQQEPVYLVWMKAHCAWMHTDKDGFDKTDPEERWMLYTSPQPAQQRDHITDGSPCWCNPELDYKTPDTGVEVWIHKEPQ